MADDLLPRPIGPRAAFLGTAVLAVRAADRVQAEAARTARAARGRSTPGRRTEAVAMALSLLALVLWWVGSRDVPLEAMDDSGLASVLPPAMWVALLLCASAFVTALRTGHRATLVAVLVVTVVVLHGLGVVTEPEMRFSVSWRHLGIADYISQRGAVDPGLDAYQSWPGFFALAAFLGEVSGGTDPTAVLAWTPVALNLLYLPPVLTIGRHLLGDGGAPWLGAWLFTASNWIGQDYFSPQGFYLLVHLVVLAVVMSRFGHPRAASAPPPPTPGASAPLPDGYGQRAVLVLVLVLLMGVTVAGHQLTPFALLLVLTGLTIAGWNRLRRLPLVLVLLVLAWLALAATAYVDGHAAAVREQVGAIGSIVDQTVGDRLTGSPGHADVVRVRLFATAGLWLLAGLGVLRLLRGRRRRAATGLVVGAAAPFPLMAVLSYGGEALLRVALFALPFMALLAAAALVGTGPVAGRPAAADAATGPVTGTMAIAVVAVASVLVFPITRYGNERMDWYAPDEVGAVRAMYAGAPPGSVLTAVTTNLPWRSTAYADHDHRVLVTGEPVSADSDPGPTGSVDVTADAGLVAQQAAARARPSPGQRSFLILTRNQAAELELLNGTPPGTYERLAAALSSSARFRVVLRSEHALLLELVEASR